MENTTLPAPVPSDGSNGHMPLAFDPQGIPAAMAREARWAIFKLEWDAVAGKFKKKPLRMADLLDGYKNGASHSNPKDWETFDTLTELWWMLPEAERPYYLPAFATGGDSGWALIDWDSVRDQATGTIVRETVEEIRALDSYTEISASGAGLHVIVRGIAPHDGHKNAQIEMYAGNRFVALTGVRLPDTPQTVETRPAAYAALREKHFPSRSTTDSTDLPAIAGDIAGEDVILRADAEPPAEKLRCLLGNLSKCADTWHHERPDLKDQSLSGYDQALANYVRLTGWSYQETADLLIAFRRRHRTLTTQPDKAWRRWDYIASVVRNADEWVLKERGGEPDLTLQDDPDAPMPRIVFGSTTIGEALAKTPLQEVVATAAAADDGRQNHHHDRDRGKQQQQEKAQDKKVRPLPVMAAAAYYGPLGTIARGIELFIEADSAALLVNLVVASGIAIGREPYIQVGAQRHHTVLNAITVGDSAENKSDGTTPIRTMFGCVSQAGKAYEVDTVALVPLITGGVSTGEGLLWQMRDERSETHFNKKTHEHEEHSVDAGINDKRLLVIEAEFARVLSVMHRENNTLSTVLRDLFDSPATAKSSPKVNPVVATEPHLGLLGQITPMELYHKLQEVELFNGFGNRFLWVLTHRIRLRPNPPDYTECAREHANVWVEAVRKARVITQVKRNSTAEKAWEAVYGDLRDGVEDEQGVPARHGVARDICARAAVMVTRISLIFAVLDGSKEITVEHHRAAMAVWNYCEACADYLFGGLTGNPIVNTILDCLASGRTSREQINALFSRHERAAVLQAALKELEGEGRIRSYKETTGGRPITWYELGS